MEEPNGTKGGLRPPCEPFYLTSTRSGGYPAKVRVNFRELPRQSLAKLTGLFGLETRPDATHDEIAAAVARGFLTWEVNEGSVMIDITDRLGVGSKRKRGLLEQLRQDQYSATLLAPDATGWSARVPAMADLPAAGCSQGALNTPRQLLTAQRSPSGISPQGKILPAANRRGEIPRGGGKVQGNGASYDLARQVAARVGGKWILARLLSQKRGNGGETGSMEVADEDNCDKRYIISAENVVPLQYETLAHKGEACLAVFPETTSFYRGIVSSDPWPGRARILVQFEDDEDLATGVTPNRSIPAEHVIPLTAIDHLASSASRFKKAARPVFTPIGTRKGLESDMTGMEPSLFAPSSGDGVVRRRRDGHRVRADGTAAAGKRREEKHTVAKKHEGPTVTYADMISHALTKLPGKQGDLKDVCEIIGRDFGDNLNWKLESDTRRTPVWQSSVRKIMHSSPRFKHTADRAIFTFASPSTR